MNPLFWLKTAITPVTISLALAVVASPSARAGQFPNYGALDIHALLDALTADEIERYNIAQARWVPADDDVAVDYAYLLGDLDGIATYNPNGSLITEGLTQIPTSWLLRVPQAWNGRLVIVVHGGAAPHNHFLDYEKRVLELGFAVATEDHPSPGFPGFPWETFYERPKALADAYFACTYLVKDLLAEVFAPAAFTTFFGESRGSGRGGGLLVGRHGNPIDGYVLVTAGAGRRDRMESWLMVLSAAVNGTGENVIPLTDQPTGIPLPLDDLWIGNLADQIGFADPNYRAYVLASLSDSVAQDRILGYHIPDRSIRIQHDWDDTLFDPDLEAKVIMIHGTDDNDVWAAGTISFGQKVIDAGKSSMIRLYIAPGQGHTPWPLAAFINSVLLMDDWVQGTPPGTLVMDDTHSVPNNWQLGYPDDAYQYFFCQFAGDCPH
jgi:hypothetical protein